MLAPHWARLTSGRSISRRSATTRAEGPARLLDEVPQELIDTYDKLGGRCTNARKLAGVAVDAVFDSVSGRYHLPQGTGRKGIVFCSMSEAIREHPELVQQVPGSVVPTGDNYFAALNSAVFSDGSFVFILRGVRCPMELPPISASTPNTGQFERT